MSDYDEINEELIEAIVSALRCNLTDLLNGGKVDEFNKVINLTRVIDGIANEIYLDNLNKQ